MTTPSLMNTTPTQSDPDRPYEQECHHCHQMVPRAGTEEVICMNCQALNRDIIFGIGQLVRGVNESQQPRGLHPLPQLGEDGFSLLSRPILCQMSASDSEHLPKQRMWEGLAARARDLRRDEEAQWYEEFARSQYRRDNGIPEPTQEDVEAEEEDIPGVPQEAFDRQLGSAPSPLPRQRSFSDVRKADGTTEHSPPAKRARTRNY
jgi:hypothetical protein